MTDLSTTITEPAAPESSTVLDAGRPADPAQHKEDAPEDQPKPKPESRMDAIKRADADLQKVEGKDEVAKEPEPKEVKTEPEKAPEVKPDSEKSEDQEQQQERQDNRKHPEPPKNFLPRAKELWRNTPREVQGEVERIVKEYEDAAARVSEQGQRYEQLREFDELARSNGRDLKDSLIKINEIETLLQRNAVAGLNQILMEIGPKKADGQPVSIYELAQYLVGKGPQAYQEMMVQAARTPQQPQQNSEVAELRTELAQMRQQQLHTQVIEPFARENPRYHELQDDIAFFLQSGRIPTSLSPSDRLAAAYDMAERINPPSHAPARIAEPQGLEPELQRRAEPDPSGTKSIKGAPSAGLSPQSGRRGKMSRGDALDAAWAELGL